MTLIRMAHASMQFSDTKKQKEHDADKLFRRATEKGWWWLTGTEAGEEPLTTVLQEAANAAGYRWQQYKGNFVSVRRDIIERDSYQKGAKTVVDNDEVVGKMHDLNYVWTEFDTEVGQITAIASHYATKGRQNTASAEYRQNTAENRRLAQAIGEFARQQGKGANLVFYGGDQNEDDRMQDSFFGGPLTSAQDELKKWESTGHGPIDVIASYNRDKRTKALKVNALDDKDFFLHTDHFLVEAVYEVGTLTG